MRLLANSGLMCRAGFGFHYSRFPQTSRQVFEDSEGGPADSMSSSTVLQYCRSTQTEWQGSEDSTAVLCIHYVRSLLIADQVSAESTVGLNREQCSSLHTLCQISINSRPGLCREHGRSQQRTVQVSAYIMSDLRTPWNWNPVILCQVKDYLKEQGSGHFC